MMNKELKRKWLKALRSGKYVQGQRQLRIDDDRPTFCCLGVLCEVAKIHYSPTLAYPPPGLDHGIEQEDIIILTKANDGDTTDSNESLSSVPWTFEEIANYIEVML